MLGVQVNVGGCKTCWGGARMKLGGCAPPPENPPVAAVLKNILRLELLRPRRNIATRNANSCVQDGSNCFFYDFFS